MQALFSFFVLCWATVSGKIPNLHVYDMLNDDAKMDHVWMEVGYTKLNDLEWTDVRTGLTNLNPGDKKEMSVFLSLPEYGGPTHEDGWPMVPKMAGRAVRDGTGAYTFSAILVQPNDSFCPKIWWTPVHTPEISVGWMIVEQGVYNVNNTQFTIDAVDITRDNSVHVLNDRNALYHAKAVFNYTTGCDSSDPEAVCVYPDKPNPFDSDKPWLHLGAIQQLQTSINKVPDDPDRELYLSVRARHVFQDRIVMMLMTHSVYQFQDHTLDLGNNVTFEFPKYPDYEDIHTPEVVSYFVWEMDLRLTCVEGLVMESQINYHEITNVAIEVDYHYTYSMIPGLFAMLGTLNSVADSTVLRVFDRTLTGSYFITQEDQCTDEEQKHTTPESAFSLVVGNSDQIGDTECLIRYTPDTDPCIYDILLVDAFGDGWGNNYFEVDVDGSVRRYDVACGSKRIQIKSYDCKFDAQMRCDGVCKTTWENYWQLVVDNMDYFGDFDSTLHVENKAVTITDPVTVDPTAKANACDQCKVAKPPGWMPAEPGAGDGEGNGAGGGAGGAMGPGNSWLLGANVVPMDGAGDGGAGSGSGSSGTLTSFIVGNGLFFSATTATKTGSAVTGVGFSSGAPGVNGASLFIATVDGSPLLLNEFTGSFFVDDATIAEILAGNVYCSIFTVDHPNGELRGQVHAVVVGTTFNVLGGNVVPAVSTTNAAMLSLYQRNMGGSEMLFYSWNLGGVDGTVTSASLYGGAPGSNGAMLYSFTDFPTNLFGVISLDMYPDIVSNLNAMYVMVMTTDHPSGELRGDLSMTGSTAGDNAGAPYLVGTANYLVGGNMVPPVSTESVGVLSVYLHIDGDHIYYHLNLGGVRDATFAYLVAGSSDDAFDSSKIVFTFDHPTYGAIPLKYYTDVADNLGSLYAIVLTDSFPNGEIRSDVSFGSYWEEYSPRNDDDKKSKPKPPPHIVPVVIELFETSYPNGWYDDSGATDAVSPPLVESVPGRRLDAAPSFDVPRILTYPEYTIANADNTKLMASGTICPQKGKRAGFERCEEPLPANGEFVFRVTGWVPEPEQDSWKFCGVNGLVGQELRFSMVKGKCVPSLPLINAPDLCEDGAAVASVIGEVLFEGVSLTEMSSYDILVFENEIISMMGSVVAVSVDGYKQTDAGLVVTFGMGVVAENYNADVSVSSNVGPLVSTLKATLSRKLRNELYLTTNEQVLAAGYPRSSLMNARSATLLSMESAGVKFVSPAPADKTVYFPVYAETSSEKQTFPTVFVVSIAGIAIAAAFVAVKIRSRKVPARFDALPTSSEHSVDFSEDRLTPFDLGMEQRGSDLVESAQ